MLSNPEIRTTFRRWGIVILLLVVIAVLVFSIIFRGNWGSTFAASEVVPISISSDMIADYGPDSFSGEVAAVSLEIIGEALFDQQPDNQNAADQLEEIVSDLQTPVPTVTPVPTMTPTDLVIQTGTVQATNTPAASSTELTITNTPLATATGTIQASNTPNPGATATPTSNATASPTLAVSQTTTSSPNPSSTSTATNTPTFTPLPTSSPTNTPVPAPTATQSSDNCSLIELTDFSVKRDDVSWIITNYGSQTILLTGTYINWPTENKELKKVKLDRRVIWDQKDKEPPTYIFLSWKGKESQREIKAGESLVILFEFDKNAAALGYFLELTFDYSCVVTITD